MAKAGRSIACNMGKADKPDIPGQSLQDLQLPWKLAQLLPFDLFGEL